MLGFGFGDRGPGIGAGIGLIMVFVLITLAMVGAFVTFFIVLPLVIFWKWFRDPHRALGRDYLLMFFGAAAIPPVLLLVAPALAKLADGGPYYTWFFKQILPNNLPWKVPLTLHYWMFGLPTVVALVVLILTAVELVIFGPDSDLPAVRFVQRSWIPAGWPLLALLAFLAVGAYYPETSVFGKLGLTQSFRPADRDRLFRTIWSYAAFMPAVVTVLYLIVRMGLKGFVVMVKDDIGAVTDRRRALKGLVISLALAGLLLGGWKTGLLSRAYYAAFRPALVRTAPTDWAALQARKARTFGELEKRLPYVARRGAHVPLPTFGEQPRFTTATESWAFGFPLVLCLLVAFVALGHSIWGPEPEFELERRRSLQEPSLEDGLSMRTKAVVAYLAHHTDLFDVPIVIEKKGGKRERGEKDLEGGSDPGVRG